MNKHIYQIEFNRHRSQPSFDHKQLGCMDSHITDPIHLMDLQKILDLKGENQSAFGTELTIATHIGMNKLTDVQRTIIQFKLIDNMSDEDLAALLRTSLEAIEKLFQMAIDELKTYLFNHYKFNLNHSQSRQSIS